MGYHTGLMYRLDLLSCVDVYYVFDKVNAMEYVMNNYLI